MSHEDEPGTVIELRRGTAANWTTKNPTLENGETGWETDTRRVKLGDGVTAWNDLAYAADEAASVVAETIRAEAAEADLQDQINAITAADVEVRDMDGNPLVNKQVVIIVDIDTDQIQDIIVEAT